MSSYNLQALSDKVSEWKKRRQQTDGSEYDIGIELRDLNASPKQLKSICADVDLPLKDAKRMLKAVLPKKEPKPKKEKAPAAEVSEDDAAVSRVKNEEKARITKIREIVQAAWEAETNSADEALEIFEAALEKIEALVQ